MKQIHFTPQMKLANLILHNFKLLPVITRFGIPLGFGEKTVAEVCSHYAVPTDFFSTRMHYLYARQLYAYT